MDHEKKDNGTGRRIRSGIGTHRVRWGGGDDAGDGTLTFATTFAADTLDPDLLPLRHMALYTAPAYDTLFDLVSGEKLEPLLATDWKAGKDKKGPYLDLTLKDGLKFPDGTTFTSATVAKNIKRSQTLKGSTNAGLLAGTTVEETDTSHARLRNSAGVGQLPRILAGAAGDMISDKAIDDKKDLTKQTAGIGSYTLESFEPKKVIFKKNTDYWDDKAAGSDTLELSYLADDAKLNAVRSGEIDVTILPDKMVSQAESAGYKVDRGYSSENYSFNLNSKVAPLDDSKVREAINIGVDRDAMCKAVLDGKCKATGQIFSAGTKEYDKDAGLGDFKFDQDRAKKLVKEAGAEGKSFTVATVAGNQDFEQITTVFQEQMKAIGLKVTIKPMAPPQVVSSFTVEKKVAAAFGAVGNAFDPAESLDRYILPKGLYNPGGYTNKKIVKAAAAAQREADPEARMKLYTKLSTMTTPDSAFVPLLTPENSYVIADHVTGWKTPWAPNFPSFRGVAG